MGPLNFYRSLVIVNGTVPLCVLVWDAYRGQLGANSVSYALHVTGILSLVFLFLSLLITPLRWATSWGGWIAFRRALGLFGFFYAVLHVAIYVGFDRSLSVSSTFYEIWTRRFLQVGTAAVFLMVPLAITSTNGMMRRVGPKNWKRLHRFAYLVAILGVIHYYMLVKSDIRQPVAFGMVLMGLLGARVARSYFDRQHSVHSDSKTNRSLSTQSQAGKVSKYWKGELKVLELVQETHEVKTFRLGAVDGSALPFDYLPGQYLNLQLKIGGNTVNRSYTIASSPTRRDRCELTIKRESLGTASRYMHDSIRVGDKLLLGAPAGKFVFTGVESESVLLIAGGVGITPLMSIVRYLTDRNWNGDIYLLVMAKTERDIIFRDEISGLQKRFPRLHVCMTLTRVKHGNTDWRGEHGRAGLALLERFVPGLKMTPTYLCGPNEMMDATRNLLISAGVADSLIKAEAFVSPVDSSGSAQSTEKVVADKSGQLELSCIRFNRSQIEGEISSDQTILEAAESLSIDLPFECRSGICGQCKIRLLKGTVRMDVQDAISRSELEQGFVLACQSHPTSNVVVDA